MFKAITPKFINRLDVYLLVNHPVLWMSKIHYAIWHGAVLWILSALLGALMPINLKDNIQYELWYFLFTVLGVVILCFWVYRYVIFNKEKNYGARKFSEEYKNFVFVFFSVTIFLLVPWPFEIVYSHRIAAIYADNEVLEDINTVNERDPYLVNSTNNYYSWYDSVTKVQYFNIRQLNPYGASYYTPYYLKADSAKFPQLLTEFQLYKKYKAITNVNDLEKRIDEFKVIAEKYHCPVAESSPEIAKRYLELLGKTKIAATEFSNYGSYQYELNYTFNNLCEAKFQTLFIFKHDYLWVMFYFIITITAFLLLFKITYWQQFLVMLVILLLYPLIMFIFSQLMPYNNFMRGGAFYESSLIALIIFGGITIFITLKKDHHYLPFFNIMNQLFYITLVYSPLLFLAFLHDNTDLFHTSDYYYYSQAGFGQEEAAAITQYDSAIRSEYYTYWMSEYARWISITKYFGIFIFIVALPLFKNLFVKQLSLPEKH
ncbi:MAG: hypothetical protein ACXVNM_09745 [Bacteroidia bacterium]